MDRTPERIVFFDGVCGLCNRAVDALVRMDDDAVLRFAPLQGETAKELLDAERVRNLDTIVYWERGVAYERTEALLRILKAIGGGWQLLFPLIALPSSWRDAAYDWVAARRYRWFGEKETCRMPTPEERELFLD